MPWTDQDCSSNSEVRASCTTFGRTKGSPAQVAATAPETFVAAASSPACSTQAATFEAVGHAAVPVHKLASLVHVLNERESLATARAGASTNASTLLAAASIAGKMRAF